MTPLSVAALSESKVYQELFSLTDESEMGHIRLSREADLVVVAPASADLLAKLAQGLADDLASTTLLATDKPVLIAPAMNTMMWAHRGDPGQYRHPANRAAFARSGPRRAISPAASSAAGGWPSRWRSWRPSKTISAPKRRSAAGAPWSPAAPPSRPSIRCASSATAPPASRAMPSPRRSPGAGRRPCWSPARRPSPIPAGVEVQHIESAEQMLAACRAALPADIAVCAAAVADWRPAKPADAEDQEGGERAAGHRAHSQSRHPRDPGGAPATRGRLVVVGFAAETEDLIANAKKKLAAKGCDLIVANDVSAGTGTFGGAENTVHLVAADGVESWPRLSKQEVAERLADTIQRRLARSA